MYFSSINYSNFMPKIEKLTDKFQHLSNCQSDQDPWTTTGFTYILNPCVNLILTTVHLTKTLERIIKVCYYLGTSLLSSLGAIFTLGKKKEINQFCKAQWMKLGLNIASTILSFGFTLANVGAGLQGFFAIKRATKNEAWLIRQQNTIDDEICSIDPRIKVNANLTLSY